MKISDRHLAEYYVKNCTKKRATCATIIFPYSNQSNHWFGVLPLLSSFLKLPINTSKRTIILLIIQIHSPLKWHDFHNTGIKSFSFLCILLGTQRIVGQRVSTKSWIALISSFLYANISITCSNTSISSNVYVKGDKMMRENNPVRLTFDSCCSFSGPQCAAAYRENWNSCTCIKHRC